MTHRQLECLGGCEDYSTSPVTTGAKWRLPYLRGFPIYLTGSRVPAERYGLQQEL